ncbi:MAG: hypothetical protein QOJ84_522 [Bradyrhizobium sp.]|nr:hypothetical protein [Bradyrhizobium sp.]
MSGFGAALGVETFDVELISAFNYPSISDAALIYRSHSTSYCARYKLDSTGGNHET